MKPNSPALLLELCHLSAYRGGRHCCRCSGARARSIPSLRMAVSPGPSLPLLYSYISCGVRPSQRSSTYVTVGELRNPSVDAGLEHVRFPIRVRLQDEKLYPAVSRPGWPSRPNSSKPICPDCPMRTGHQHRKRAARSPPVHCNSGQRAKGRWILTALKGVDLHQAGDELSQTMHGTPASRILGHAAL